MRFDANLPLEEVDRRVAAMRASIEGGIPGAHVAILPWSDQPA
jgi:hypothetical protein